MITMNSSFCVEFFYQALDTETDLVHQGQERPCCNPRETIAIKWELPRGVRLFLNRQEQDLLKTQLMLEHAGVATKETSTHCHDVSRLLFQQCLPCARSLILLRDSTLTFSHIHHFCMFAKMSKSTSKILKK